MRIRSSEILPYRTSSYDEVSNAYVPAEAVVSLVQDRGRPAVCTVRPGDVVTEGQVIAAGTALHSSVIHSPLPGTVSGLVSCSMPDGKRTPAVKIRMGGEFSLLGKPRGDSAWASVPPASLRRLIVDSGVVNTFDEPLPLGGQLAAACEVGTPAVVVRMFDKDPSCSADGFVARRYHGKVAEGARIAAAACGAKDVVLFYPAGFGAGKDGLPGGGGLVAAAVDTSCYPCGGRRELIQVSAGKNFPFRRLLPSDLFMDSCTALAVYEAAVTGQPVVDKLVQVSGRALYGEGMVRARVGTTLRALAAEFGGFVGPPAKIIVNGLVNGINVSDLDTPVTKYVKSVIFMPKGDLTDQAPGDCIRCGKCRAVCPSGLVPDVLYSYYKFRRESDAEYAGTAARCSGCVLCNSACPSRLPLCQTITLLKGLHDEP